MLGMYHLLPFLKGWRYEMRHVSRSAVVRGAAPIEVARYEERGWLQYIDLLTTDCYGTLIVDFQDAELDLHRIRVYPEALVAYGFVQQDPYGWASYYNRPIAASTAGVYYITAWSGGGHGATLPYIPTVIISLHLPTDSTQDSAYIHGYMEGIVVADDRAFMLSLRKVLGIKETKIDPALLEYGPAVFEEEEG